MARKTLTFDPAAPESPVEVVIPETSAHDLAAILTDWFARDSSTFIHASHADRLDWEKEVEGGAYSTFIGGRSAYDAIRVAYSRGRDIITTFAFGKPVALRISKAITSYTSGKSIHVSTAMFDDPDYTIHAAMDVFMGLAAHECCHCEWTDFTEIRRRLNPENPDHLVKFLQNLFEDERIERRMGDKFPGFSRFLETVKYYYFEHKWLEGLDKVEDENEVSKTLGILLRLIRYPKHTASDVAFIEKHLRLFSTIKEALTPYPDNTKESFDAAFRVAALIRFYFGTEEEEREKVAFEVKLSGGESGDGSIPVDELPSDVREKVEELMRKLLEAMEDILDSGVDDPATSTEAAEKPVSKALDEYKAEEIEGTVFQELKNCFFIKAETNLPRYTEVLRKVQRAASTMGAITKLSNRGFAFTSRGRSTGRLDTSKYSDALAGSPNVYTQLGVVKSRRLAVVGLVDESGSMHGSAIDRARETMVLLEQAFIKNPDIDLFLYGHTGDIRFSGATEMRIYREKGYAPRGALGSVSARSQNRDGDAILSTAKRVRRLTQDPILMFVVADGQPCANNYGGARAVSHVRECVTRAQNKYGCTIIQVAIGSSYIPSKEMFDHHVNMENIDQLPRTLSALIQKVVLRESKIDLEVL